MNPKNILIQEHFRTYKKNLQQDELSCAKLSSLSWGWVEIKWSWDWVELRMTWSWNWDETELGKYLNSSIEIFEVFNWSIWSLVPFYYFPGWVGGLGLGDFWFFNLIDFFLIRFFPKNYWPIIFSVRFFSKIHSSIFFGSMFFKNSLINYFSIWFFHKTY